MYLKSIEIQGFKSFAGKTVLEFHDGITGIVGPNGSGKSNIADAVRWVLGEQKYSQLRSSGTQDVIFAGTESRRPVSFAYVAITFDNTDGFLAIDYSEVTVARRIYRSGESEYLLNGTQCRLRDIHELFYDTGIGQEGYSIIGQGQIDKILSGRPEERRELFDEAAGIVKFKRRKQTTLKKLENERGNMLRISDVMNELEGRVGPLSRQAERARTYLKKKEELKSCEVGVFLYEMDRVEREGTAVAEKQRIASSQLADTQEELAAILAQYEDLDREIRDNDAAIGRLQTRIGECDVEREKGEGRIAVLREQIRAIEQSESHVKERLEELEADIARREQAKEQYCAEREETDARIDEVREELQDLADAQRLLRQTLDESGRRIESGQSEILKLLDERATAEGEQQRCNTRIEQADLRTSQLQQQLIRQQSTERDAADRLSEQEALLAEQDRQIRGLREQQADIEEKRRKRGGRIRELEAEIDRVRQQYHRESSALESLRNIAERYDGYGSGIRRVMERKGQVPGIHGVIADLIRVEPRCETAIETALGGSIQNVVTGDEAAAKQMISYLKKNRYGRVTFLPLSSVTAPTNVPARKALGEPGVIGMADTLVETDEIYRGVVGHLLGRVLVVDDVDHALAIAKKYNYSLRIVTLEGESLMPGGSIAGGAFRNSSNLLGRGREIESLEKQTAGLARREQELRERLAREREGDELLAGDREKIRSALQNLSLRKNTLQVEVEHLRGEREQQEEFYAGVREELRELADRKEELARELDRIGTELERSREREAELSAANEERSEELSGLRAEEQGMRERESGLTVELAQLRQKSDFSGENIDRVAAEILDLHNAQQEVLLTASNSGQEIAHREEEIRELAGAGQAALAERETLEGELDACRGKKERMADDHREFFDRREALQQELGRLDRELFRLGDQQEKLDRIRETQTDYMWQEYELTYHEAERLRTEDAPGVTELRRRTSALRGEIRALGDVNVNAIEEYRSVSERYEFLKAQYEDLQQGERKLVAIIADLDKGMRAQFTEKFADIREEFGRTFTELFGGGKGTLELAVDAEHDILDCGIGINAQPPGKKLRNMMQLSGGERALTAIALLFAIQNRKPSPFCLLDEIEAALDDSNVGRFAKYLQRLAKNTQFIVITHRRGTMNVADRLFGVTMQEKGVSAIVSVNLVEKELD